MQGVRGGGEIHGRADRGHGSKLCWPRGSPLPRQLEHQVATHGKPRQRQARDAVLIDQILGYGRHILGASRMVESGRLSLSATTVTLIHADYVHAQSRALRGDSKHVLRITGALEAVHHHHGQRFLAVSLPVTMSQNLYS